MIDPEMIGTVGVAIAVCGVFICASFANAGLTGKVVICVICFVITMIGLAGVFFYLYDATVNHNALGSTAERATFWAPDGYYIETIVPLVPQPTCYWVNDSTQALHLCPGGTR